MVELDTTTLRVSFGVVALTMLVLFYFVSFRTSRSTYCAWWCVALGLFVAGSVAYLLDGTSQQVWANPLGSTLFVAGTSSVWAGARALGGRPFQWAPFATGPAVTLVAAAFDDPSTNTWAGGAPFLAAMSLTVALASRELWLVRPSPAELLRREATFSPAVRTLAILSGAFSAFYALRFVSFVFVSTGEAILSDAQTQVYTLKLGFDY